MRYINFVLICICLLSFLSISANAMEIGPVIHYSEQDVKVDQKVDLDIDYYFVVRDINTKSGDLWIEIYHDGEKLDSSDNFARENSPLEYVKTVELSDDEEKDYLVIRITSFGDVDGSGSDMTSKIKVEQFDDGTVDDDSYIIYDRKLTLDEGTPRSMGDDHSLEVSYIDEDDDGEKVVALKLLKGRELLKTEELHDGDYFYYTIYTDVGPDTIFISRLDGFFESSDSEMVFLDQVSLKKSASLISESVDVDGESITVENGVSLIISSSDGGKLFEGDMAIIRYGLPESFSTVKLLMNEQTIDSRNDVDIGVYSAASGKLTEGTHVFSLVGVSDGKEKELISETITIEASIMDSMSSSAKDLAESANNAIGSNDNTDSTIPGISDSTVITLLICTILFLLIYRRK
jgi:hypothetical protein